MTHNEFRQDEAKRARIREILDDRVFQEAVAAVREFTEPKPGELDRDPVSKAARYDQRAGMNLLLKGLQDLTEPPKALKKLSRKELAANLDDLPTEE